MEDDVPEISKQECSWALKKWRRSRPPPSDKIPDLLTRMISEGVIPDKHQTWCDGLKHKPDLLLDEIVERVAERREHSLKVFLHVLENLDLEMKELRMWLHRACSPCNFASPVLLSTERTILNDAKAAHDLKILTCPASWCNSIMLNPVLLKCLHSCCEDCLRKNDNCCPACKMKHDGELLRNFSLEGHMKFWATKIASTKCVTCPTAEVTPSKFCFRCEAYYCLRHCCTNGHKLEEKEVYLIKKEREFYQLSCSFHERKMVFYCQKCRALRCDRYVARCLDNKHTCNSLFTEAKEPRDYMQSFMKLHGLPMDKAVYSHLETSCTELQTQYQKLLVKNSESAVKATKDALQNAEEELKAYCDWLEEYSKPLLYWIDQAGIYFNFLLKLEDAWIVQQWPVVSHKLHLMDQMGLMPPTFAEGLLKCNMSPTAFQSSTGANHAGGNCMLLQVDYVDPSSGTSAALIEQLVGVPKKSAGSPAKLLEMLKTIQNDAQCVMKPKEHFDIVAKLSEQERIIDQLQRENAELRSNQKTMEEQQARTNHSSRIDSDLVKGLTRASADMCQKMTLEEVKNVVRRLRSLDLLCVGDADDIQKDSNSPSDAARKLIDLALKRDSTFVKLFVNSLRKDAKRQDLVDLIQLGKSQ